MTFPRVPSYLPACITANLVSPPDHSTSMQRGLPCSGLGGRTGLSTTFSARCPFPEGLGKRQGACCPAGWCFGVCDECQPALPMAS